jgi:hypothetical protein
MAQLSPGTLSNAHQSLSGVAQCTSCHTLRIGAADLKCQECHTEIAQRLAQKRGFHATIVKNASDSKECATCHSEHNGADFNLIRWEVPLDRFDHRQTGYALQGKHGALPCQQCHAPTHIRPAERATIRVRNLNKTYLGLTTDCVTCHQDPHSGRLGANCTGLHAQVACEKCHASSGPQGTTKLSGLAFGSCKDCHQDPHRGSFAQTCDTCHTTGGWGTTRNPTSFDHSKTAFALLGKHAEVGCSKCHTAGGGDFRAPVAHSRCIDCHSTDPHMGQFRDRVNGIECSSCHTVDSFQTTTFGVKEHATSRYPLQGKHAMVECSQCHTPAGSATKFKIAYGECLDCHSDAHQGQFAAAPYQNRCESCHGFEGYRPALFTLADHQKTRFPLEGAHLAIPCGDCHVRSTVAGATTAKFQFAERTCSVCHSDPHAGKFQATMDRIRADGTRAGCQGCHNVRTWRDAAGFDHATTSFSLTGAHRTVTCAECHLNAKASDGSRDLTFSGAPKLCSGCHQDPHGGQFVRAGAPTICSDCHITTRWSPSNFDHETKAAFSLAGAHQSVTCASCHTLWKEVNGRLILFYSPTPTVCSGCHADLKSGGQ